MKLDRITLAQLLLNKLIIITFLLPLSLEAEDGGWEDLTAKNPKAVEVEKAQKKAPSQGAKPDNVGKKIKYWVAPMDPKYVREGPGKSPMGMDLVPVYEDENSVVSPAGTVRVDPVMVQNMGVRVVKLEPGRVVRKVRTIGEVEVAEDQMYVVNLRYSGWIEKIWADQTGQRLSKGEKLFEIYSPEIVAAQEEFLLAVQSKGEQSSLASSAQKRLRQWDVPNSHIKEVLKSKNGSLRLIVRAPLPGYILHKNVVLGNRVKSGMDLYRIGNLDKVWIKAEVYEFDAPWIKLDQKAQMSLSFQQGKTWEGKVSYIYPTINQKSRTLTIRLEFDNPTLKLKPGMFATIYIDAQEKNGILTVPNEAIIHSGQRQIVFVSPEIGFYEPREIVTGLVGDNHYTEVLSGLALGDMAVISGQFLLDSESQLQEAITKMLRAKLQKANGSSVGKSPTKSQTSGKATKHTFYTCSMHPQVVESEPGTCPICKMDLVERDMP